MSIKTRKVSELDVLDSATDKTNLVVEEDGYASRLPLVGAIASGGKVTPQLFGAVGDGVTDDTAAFNKAIEAGGTVVIPEGTYRIDGTINLKNGVRIEGNKNSVIEAYGETVFHLARHNTLTGFAVKVKSSVVMSVFEIDDESISNAPGEAAALLYDRIIDVDVHNDCSAIPEMFTVCHFHTETKGMYDVIVRDCNFRCNATTGGYAARVYADGGWLNTVTFDCCNTANFVWHYFFANNDKEIIAGTSEGHIISGCVAQCTTNTKGFVFITSQLTVSMRNCEPWDWASEVAGSSFCFGRPYVLKNGITAKNAWVKNNEFGDDQRVIFYNGTEFTEDSISYKQGLLLSMGNRYDHSLIPKYVGVKNGAKAVKIMTSITNYDSTRVRFYIANSSGITYVSVYPKSKTVEVDRPLVYGYKIGGTPSGAIYLYRDDGYGIDAGTGILSLPLSNTNKVFSAKGTSIHTYEKTAEIWKDPDSNMLSEVPEDIEQFTLRRSMPAYLPGDDGKIYSLKVVTADDGTKSLSFAAASTIKSEYK